MKIKAIKIAESDEGEIYAIVNGPKPFSRVGIVKGQKVYATDLWGFLTQIQSYEKIDNGEFLKDFWKLNFRDQDWHNRFIAKFNFNNEKKLIENQLVVMPNDGTPPKPLKSIKQPVRRRVLGKKKSMAGKIEVKGPMPFGVRPNKPKPVPSVGGGTPSVGRALKPAVFDPRSVDIDNDGWHQEGTTAAWFGAGVNNPIVLKLKEEMKRIGEMNEGVDLTGMAIIKYGVLEGAPDTMESNLEADLAWLGGKLIQANQESPGVVEVQWLLGRQQVRKQRGIRDEVLPVPSAEQIKDSDVYAVLEEAIEVRKKGRTAKDSKLRVVAGDLVDEKTLELARNYELPKGPDAKPFDDADVLREIFEFDFVGMDGEKYSVVVNNPMAAADIYGGDQGLILISGKIMKNGKQVGFVDRTLYPDLNAVEHVHLHLDEDVRGAQISGIINSRNELIYRAMGIDTINTHATSNIGYNGATHWPKMGFDWEDEYSRQVYLDAIDSALTEFALGVSKDPDALPMVKKYRSDGSFVNIPIFASREEAEEVAMLLTLARTQKLDDEDRITAGDLVNWHGAEAWFQGRNIEANLIRNVGGQVEIDEKTTSEQLQKAGYSPEEIKKIQNYMSRRGLSGSLPTPSEIQKILNPIEAPDGKETEEPAPKRAVPRG